MEFIASSDLKQESVNCVENPIFITDNGRPKAVMIDIDHYNAMMDAIEDIDDSKNMKVIQERFKSIVKSSVN